MDVKFDAPYIVKKLTVILHLEREQYLVLLGKLVNILLLILLNIFLLYDESSHDGNTKGVSDTWLSPTDGQRKAR